MPVYVDDMYRFKVGEYRRGGRVMKMSHLIADTREELLAMARKIGMNVRWIQYPGTHKEHFDICMEMRDKAVAAGAIEVPMRTSSAMCAYRREHNRLATPSEAVEWSELVAQERADRARAAAEQQEQQ